jgi:hypothetical protein
MDFGYLLKIFLTKGGNKMIGKFFKGIKDWWDNNKNVVHNFVIPKLSNPELIQKIAELMRIPEDDVRRLIAVIADYLKRQL